MSAAQPGATPSLDEPLQLTYLPGDILFTEGDGSDRSLYVLLEGTVEVCKGIFTLAQVGGRNTFLGEMSTLLKCPRSATVIAREPCRVVVIPEEQATSFFNARPALAVQLATVLAERLQRMNERYEEAMRLSTERLLDHDPLGEQATEEAEEQVMQGPGGLARLANVDETLALTDVAVPDITFVNGSPVTEAVTPIRNGDKVQIGSYLLHVFDDHPELIDTAAIEAATAAQLTKSTERTTALVARAEELPAAGAQVVQEVDRTALRERLAELAEPGPDDAVRALVERRLAVQENFRRLVARREGILETGEASEDCLREARRQERETKKLPPLQTMKDSVLRLQRILGEGPGGAELPADPMYAGLLSIGLDQVRELIAWESGTVEVIEAGVALSHEEPLRQILEKLGVSAGGLFGLGTYLFVLRAMQQEGETHLQGLRRCLKELSTEKTLFSGPSDSEQEAAGGVRGEIEQASQRLTLMRREQAWLEPRLVEQFWRVYEVLGCYLASGRVAVEDQPYVRAFLRWGMIGCSELYLPREHVERIVLDCARPLRALPEDSDATAVLYADEYLCLVGAGQVTPSINEDLELNQQGSELWKADRAWRRKVHSASEAAGYLRLATQIEGEEREQRRELQRLERTIGALNEHDPATPRKRQQLKSQAQEARVDAARLARNVTRLREELVPELRAAGEAAELKLQEASVGISTIGLARQEAQGIRQVSKLVAKLNEPFLPFALQSFYRPGQNMLQDREAVELALGDAEERDPMLFHELVIGSSKKARQVTLRRTPIVVLAPAQGHLGFLWNPRHGSEVGRLVLPAYCQRSGQLEHMVWDLLADFRYASSKASAGVDLLKSDTLVAAYANVRWMYRKKSEEARRKAVIYMEEKEARNWRRHYQLWMRSAHDSAKQLFYKCPELYELLLKYIDLPAGVEPLRRR